jgi:hypothetical protein
MKWKCFLRSFQLICIFFTLLCCSVSGSLAEGFAPGSQLPQFTLSAPDSPQTQNYLGLKAMGPFSISDVRSKVLIVEFLSAT